MSDDYKYKLESIAELASELLADRSVKVPGKKGEQNEIVWIESSEYVRLYTSVRSLESQLSESKDKISRLRADISGSSIKFDQKLMTVSELYKKYKDKCAALGDILKLYDDVDKRVHDYVKNVFLENRVDSVDPDSDVFRDACQVFMDSGYEDLKFYIEKYRNKLLNS